MSSLANWSGERLETFVSNENTLEHLHRYALACNYIKGKVVLDLASGEGYGSFILSSYAKKVYGIDIDENTINLAKQKYVNGNIEFRLGSADLIPLENASVDAVTSFETLEHHDKHIEMLLEIKRVLKPNGLLIISTPEKMNYSDKKNYTNPFHIKELYLEEFRNLLYNHFKNVKLLYQNMFFGSLIIPEISSDFFKSFQGSFDSINLLQSFDPMYVIGLASNAEDFSEIAFPSSFTNDEIVKDIQLSIFNRGREEGVNWIKNSKSYKLGNFLLRPLRFLKRSDD